MLLQLLPFGLLLGLWQASVSFGLVDRTFLPGVDSVTLAFLDLLRGGELLHNLAASMFRAFAGLAIGVALGLAMATSRGADRFFGPLVATTYSLPKTALVPLFILWFGVGDVTNILTVVLACLLPIVVSTYHGVKAVPEVILWSARAMGTPRTQMLGRVLLPASLSATLAGIRIALGFCFVLTISAEMIAAKTGVGKLIFLYGESGSYAHMFAGILAVVGIAFAADRGLVGLTNYLLRWHETVAVGGAHG